MLNKSFLFCLAALVAAPVALGVAPKIHTEKFLGVEHTCVEGAMCWSEEHGLLISSSDTALIYVEAELGKFPKLRVVKHGVYQAWVKSVLVPTQKNVSYMQTLTQVDAINQKRRTIQETKYNVEGEVVYSNNAVQSWSYMPPQSIGSDVIKALSYYGGLAETSGKDLVEGLDYFADLPEE